MENLSFYGHKISSKTDIDQQLYKYEVEKVYNKEILHLVLYALANCTNSTIVIIYVHEGCVEQFEMPRTRKEGAFSQRFVTLAHIGEHYESVVDNETSNIPVIVISGSDSTTKKSLPIVEDSDSTSFAEIQDHVFQSEFKPMHKS